MPRQVTYWTSTVLVSAMLAASAGTYLFHKPTIDGFRDLGFPDFFRIQLAILKILAIPVLLLPQVPIQMKEWAYAGVALYLITAIVAHHVHRDPIVLNMINAIFFGLLIASNVYLQKKTNTFGQCDSRFSGDTDSFTQNS